MEISKDEFVEWKNHPVTKEIMLLLDDKKSKIRDVLSSGEILGDNTEKAVARLVGHLEGIDDLLNIQYGDEEDIND